MIHGNEEEIPGSRYLPSLLPSSVVGETVPFLPILALELIITGDLHAMAQELI